MLRDDLDVLDLLRKVQEVTTEDVDEEIGSFKKGDKVIYDMYGCGYTDSDFIKITGVSEHANRLNHHEKKAIVVEAEGDKVSRYDIVFKDGFAINGLSASELKLEEFKTNEAEKVPQTMQPQEKPDLNADDLHMEDYSEEDFNKPDAKIKSKSPEKGDAIRNVEDDELKIEPDKVVKPKKESKVDEQEHEITPSLSGLKKLDDKKLIKLHDNSIQSFKYWKNEGFADKAGQAAKAVKKYEDEMVLRGVISSDQRTEGIDSYVKEKKESNFSFMRKQNPLWLCNECSKTFRSNMDICENCQSKNVEKISELKGLVGFIKHVYQVDYKDGEAEDSIRVEAFDEEDAKEMVKKTNPGVELLAVKKIGESKLSEQIEVKIGDTFEDEKGKRWTVTDVSKKSIGLRKWGAKDIQAVYWDKFRSTFTKVSNESKLTETVSELIGEVPDVSSEDNQILRWAVKNNVLFNEWPPNDILIQGLQAKLPEEEKEKLETAEAIDLHVLYLKYILLPRARKAWRERDVGASLESKEVKEAEDVFKTVAKGVVDKDSADEIASREKGMVIQDPEDEKKFAIIVKESKKIREEFDEKYRYKVKINAYVDDLKDGEGIEVVDDEQQLVYDIDVEHRSWGLKDITVKPRGVMEFSIEILDVDDKVVDTVPVKIDFDSMDYTIDWQKGSGYVPDTLDIRLTRDGKITEVTLNFFYVDPSR